MLGCSATIEAARVDALIERPPEGGARCVVSGEAGGQDRRGRAVRVLERDARASDADHVAASFRSGRSLRRVSYASSCPVLGRQEPSPGPRRRALEAAFGVTDDLEPEPFHVALAALQLVCDAADTAPLVLVVDDAHWLDRSSLAVLTFIARRLENEPVALLASVRAGYATPLEDARCPCWSWSG